MPRNPFDEIYRRIMKQFFKDLEDMEKQFDSQERPVGKPPEYSFETPGRATKSGGFSISISSNGENPPRVEVRRFGPSGEWEKISVGAEGTGSERAARAKESAVMSITPSKLPPRGLKERAIPEHDVAVDVNGVTITMNARGVEDEDDVKLKFYPESVEIHAAAPKLSREYFCAVALPASIDKRGATVRVDKAKVLVKIPRRPHSVQSQ